jgi:ankyrin repeat protein
MSDVSNDRALIYAARDGHLDVISYLITLGADVHTREDQALIHAVTEGHLDVVMYLISQGADVSAREDKALIYAARYGHSDVLSLLLDMYEDPEHLRSRPEVRYAMSKISRERSVISSSLRAGTNIVNLISAYY